MSHQPPADDPKNIWQDQGREHENMSLQEIRQKVRKLQLKHRTNAIIGIVILIVFAVTLTRVKTTIDRIAFTLICLGTLRMVIVLAKASSGGPQDSALTTSVQFYRSRLHTAHSFPRLWGFGAILFFSGSLILVGEVMVNSVLHPPPLKNILPFCIILAAWGISFIVIGRRQRRWVKQELERLDLLEREGTGRP